MALDPRRGGGLSADESPDFGCVDERDRGGADDHPVHVAGLDRRGNACWLYSAVNLAAKHRGRFAALRDTDLKTARAWAIKETFRHFFEYHRKGWAQRHWKSWFFWATHSRLQPVIDAAYTLKRHQAGLFSYFDHRITSAGAEGLNSRIQAIRVRARGYRNREHFKTAIYFHLGGLDLQPQTHSVPG
jgi:transposase